MLQPSVVNYTQNIVVSRPDWSISSSVRPCFPPINTSIFSFKYLSTHHDQGLITIRHSFFLTVTHNSWETKFIHSLIWFPHSSVRPFSPTPPIYPSSVQDPIDRHTCLIVRGQVWWVSRRYRRATSGVPCAKDDEDQKWNLDSSLVRSVITSSILSASLHVSSVMTKSGQSSEMSWRSSSIFSLSTSSASSSWIQLAPINFK